MTGHRAVFDLRGSVCDQDQVSDVSPWVLAAMWSTTRAPGSQTGGELLPQRPTGLDEQRPIDGVVRHAHREVVRVVHPQSGTDLLRRPPRVQQRFHLGAEPGPPAEFCGPWPPCLRVGCLVSATTVAVDLAAHGGRRPSKTTRDRRYAELLILLALARDGEQYGAGIIETVKDLTDGGRTIVPKASCTTSVTLATRWRGTALARPRSSWQRP